jgi:hypothetical protein
MTIENTAYLVSPAAGPPRTLGQPPDSVREPPMWLTNGLLMLASSTLLVLACASAWLSYHAQVAYVLVHNGDNAAEARVWALLLDAGTAGVSLLRLYETLRRRPVTATRASLLGCIAASVTMNLLHTPSRTPGGFLVAAVPPLLYAVLLEHLVSNLRSLLTGSEDRIDPWHAVMLWVHFPVLMWSRWRKLLRCAADGVPAGLEHVARVGGGASDVIGAIDHLEQKRDRIAAERNAAVPGRPRRGRGPGPKRIAFETALADQVRSGDLRLFSADERERNAAAYEAAASLPAPLSRGAVRRYVVQALPRLEKTGAIGELSRAGAASTTHT